MTAANTNTWPPPPEAPSQGGGAQEVRHELFEFLKMVVLFLILFSVLRWCVVEGYKVEGPSMYPTLEDNDRILVFKLPLALSHLPGMSGLHAIHPGDIVVFNSPDEKNKRYVKRIVAEGPSPSRSTVSAQGQSAPLVNVRIAEGRLYINNNLQEEPYLSPSTSDMRGEPPVNVDVGNAEFFVMGDHRNVSRDSRTFGPIDEDAIIGRAVFRIWPLSRFGFL